MGKLLLSVSFQRILRILFIYIFIATAESQEHEIIRTELDASLRKLRPKKSAAIHGIVAE